ncbi:class II fructose-bisphosphate aldolase [Pseudolactococcus reticulitermitis]|uniref:Tagatose-bisphosphate aldolase n=1 Tax=Pseudolactococcus reticulitermitis TaxID=2025039 RepID=A0A224XAP4_9LACT|nr:class II fructose-bisphosphate aldolase [Lactococcus reticulitermitis]GAX46733.1 tagatose-bisphosphate aldolase [Lactococcus reticulitermitis]GHU40941.1 fructose-bisphosphate aldolase [Bacilli bacterium]
MLVTSKEMILKAQAGHYAVGAFNIENMEMAMAAVKAAEDLNAPIILQTTPGTVDYATLELYFANVKAIADKAKVPVAIHLDHGSSFELAMQALHAGYTSIMIDGSHLPFDENVSVSRRVVEACHPNDIPVEAELGKVGGKEDKLDGGSNNPYTEPDEAKAFVAQTDVDFLAIAVGTIHGIYKGEPKIDMVRLSEIRQVVDIPLVLHGTSGVPDDQVREAIKRGICKVNYATDLRIAYTKGARANLADEQVIDPKKYGEAGMKEVYALVADKIKVVGSDHKA